METTNILTGNKETGDTRNARNQCSNESMISVLFPWRGGNTLLKRRPIVSDNESGRIISPTDFYLCMMAVLLLCTSAGLIAVSAWLIIYRLPFLYITDGSFFLESNTFTLFASLISIPCCWITWICHYDKKNYTFLPLLIIILGFSMSMLSIGISVGLVHKSKMSFDKTTDPPKLLQTHYKLDMNNTMTTAMALYDINANYRYAWNKIQHRLKCCGVEYPHDWLHYRHHLPQSCYLDSKCPNPKFMYLRGCLDIMSYDLAWEICLLTGLSMITFAVQLVSLLLGIVVYLKAKINHSNDDGAI